jgi:hypothetical protein
MRNCAIIHPLHLELETAVLKSRDRLNDEMPNNTKTPHGVLDNDLLPCLFS